MSESIVGKLFLDKSAMSGEYSLVLIVSERLDRGYNSEGYSRTHKRYIVYFPNDESFFEWDEADIKIVMGSPTIYEELTKDSE